MSYEMIKSGKTGNYISEGQTKIHRTGLSEPLKGDSNERQYQEGGCIC